MLSKISSYIFIFCIIGTIVIWSYVPSFNVPGIYLGLGFLILISSLVWAFSQYKNLWNWFKSRGGQFFISLGFSFIGFLILFGIINWVTSEYNYKKDLTKNKFYTLSEQSKKVVKDLNSEVQIQVWSSNIAQMSGNINVEKFLENYTLVAGSKVKVEYKSPIHDKNEFINLGLQKDNIIFVKSSNGSEYKIDSFEENKIEQQLTSALINVSNTGGLKKVCFVSGHGELSSAQDSPFPISLLTAKIEFSSYQAKSITLFDSEKVDPECNLLMLLGPKSAPLKGELEKIITYFENGGNIFIAFGPDTPKDWKAAFSNYGIVVNEDIVVQQGVQPPIAVVSSVYSFSHPAVKDLKQPIAFVEVSTLSNELKNNGYQYTPILSTTEQGSYVKKGNMLKITDFNKAASDKTGSIPIAFSVYPESVEDKAVAKNKLKGKAIFVGSYKFLTDELFGRFANASFTMNLINDILNDQKLIGIRPRELRQATLELTESRLRQVVGTLFLLAIVFVFGAFAAHRRRMKYSG